MRRTFVGKSRSGKLEQIQNWCGSQKDGFGRYANFNSRMIMRKNGIRMRADLAVMDLANKIF